MGFGFQIYKRKQLRPPHQESLPQSFPLHPTIASCPFKKETKGHLAEPGVSEGKVAHFQRRIE